MAKSTSVSDIKLSVDGEPNVTAVAPEVPYTPPIPVIEDDEDQKGDWVIFKLLKHKKGRLYVDGCDDVVVGGKTERIWLLNGVQSIWQRDLMENIKDKDFMRTSRRSLEFQNGVCRLPPWDKLAIEFARTTRHNVKMKGRRDVSKQAFYEYDPAAQQKAELAKKMVRIKAIQEASLMPHADMIKHAYFLGVGFIDELMRPKTEDGIRAEYIMKADANPEYWNKTKGTPEVERLFLIKEAILDSRIDFSNGVIRWAQNGGFICNQPVGKSPQDCMLELAMSPTPEGKAFLSLLKTKNT